MRRVGHALTTNPHVRQNTRSQHVHTHFEHCTRSDFQPTYTCTYNGACNVIEGVALEAWATRVLGKQHGFSTVQLRRVGSCTAIAMQAFGLLMLGICASQAAASGGSSSGVYGSSGNQDGGNWRLAVAAQLCAVLGSSWHTMGYAHSFQEVGGRDTGVLSGISNQVANLSGIAVPAVVVMLQRNANVGGSNSIVGGTFMQAVPVLVLAGVVYGQYASTTPAALTFIAKSATRAEVKRKKKI